MQNMVPLGVGKGPYRSRRVAFHQMFEFVGRDAQVRPGAHNHGPLDEILQFADVPWPIVEAQEFQDFARDMADILANAARELVDEVTYQQRNIFQTLS